MRDTYRQEDAQEIPFSPYVTKYRAVVTRFPDGSGEGVMNEVDVWRGTDGPECGAALSPAPLSLLEPVDDSESRRQKSLERACRRARKQVRLAIKAYQCDHLLTLTWRENMTDLEQGKEVWAKFRRAVAAKHTDWVYVAVPEWQQRGALHIHVAVRGYQDVKWLRRCWYRALGGRGEERGTDAPGQINVRGPRRRAGSTWSRDRLAMYLSKYIAKDISQAVDGAKRYWATRGYSGLLRKTVIWLEAGNGIEAIVQTYHLVAGGMVEGVTHWCSPDARLYWIACERPPDKPPF